MLYIKLQIDERAKKRQVAHLYGTPGHLHEQEDGLDKPNTEYTRMLPERGIEFLWYKGTMHGTELVCYKEDDGNTRMHRPSLTFQTFSVSS